MKTCYECGKRALKRKMVDYHYHGISLGKFLGEVCRSCGETFFKAEASTEIEGAAKKAGVWGISSITKVGRSGNNLDVRITNRLANFVGLAKGKEVMVRPEGKNRLVIEVG